MEQSEMTIEMKIPKGWYKLNRGTIIEDGDKFHDIEKGWLLTEAPGVVVGSFAINLLTYIRPKSILKKRKATNK